MSATEPHNTATLPYDVDISREIESVMGKILAVEDPAMRVVACTQVYAQLQQELIIFLGPSGERGNAARQAREQYGSVRAAADAAGMTTTTFQRVLDGR